MSIEKQISNYSDYTITDEGVVYSYKSGTQQPRTLGTSGPGYKIVQLFHNGKFKSLSVHRLVVETFVRKLSAGEVVNHIDGNKLNNNLSNLEIVSQKTNLNVSQDYMKSRNSEGRIKPVVCLETGVVYKSGNYAAKMHNVSPMSIQYAVYGVMKVHGFTFEYVNQKDKDALLDNKSSNTCKKLNYIKLGKFIVDKNTNKEWATLKACAMELKVTTDTIRKHIKKKTPINGMLLEYKKSVLP